MFMMSFCGPAGLFPFYSSSQMVSTVKGLIVRIPVKAGKCGILITPDCSPTVFLWMVYLPLLICISELQFCNFLYFNMLHCFFSCYHAIFLLYHL